MLDDQSARHFAAGVTAHAVRKYQQQFACALAVSRLKLMRGQRVFLVVTIADYLRRCPID
jgi:hypothetical protein